MPYLKTSFLLLFLGLYGPVSAQEQEPVKTRVVIGVSAPELLHTGISYDLGKSNQIGLSVGVAPSWGSFWPSVSAEHRLYLGNINTATNRRQWFFKQGVTKFPTNSRQTAVTLTAGKDLKSRTNYTGWTIDAGLFKLYKNVDDRENRIGPAFRVQYYLYFRKDKA